MDSLSGKVDSEPIRDLLGTPRRCPPSILSPPMTTTHPAHFGSWHQLDIRAGDHPTQTIRHIVAKLVVPRPASRPSDGWHAALRATEQSWPDTRSPCYGLRRCAPTHAKPSTHNDPSGGRSHAPQHPAHEIWRSLPARETTDNVPTPNPARSAASHQPGGTISTQPPATPPPRQPRPRSKHHQRPPPKTGPDPHAALQTADQATTSGHVSHEPPADPSQHSS